MLRAAVILGSGSASFEMLRYLAERLPVMVTPKWVHVRIQPIAIRDVLRYLVGCATLPKDVNRSFDIGGPHVLTYADMIRLYAAVARLPRRFIIPVPLLTPRLSSLWVVLVTPVPGSLAKPLVESLRNEVVCREHDIEAYVPDPPEWLTGFDQAVQLALQQVRGTTVTAPGRRRCSQTHPAIRCRRIRTGPVAACTSTSANKRLTLALKLCGGRLRPSAVLAFGA